MACPNFESPNREAWGLDGLCPNPSGVFGCSGFGLLGVFVRVDEATGFVEFWGLEGTRRFLERLHVQTLRSSAIEVPQGAPSLSTESEWVLSSRARFKVAG